MNDEESAKIFKAEACDLLETIERGLLDLEQTPSDSAIVAKVFRAMHTLKGSGAMFGFDELADFAHHCENAFDRVRKGLAEATPELICAVLAALDHLRALAEGETPPPEEGAALQALLDDAVGDSTVHAPPRQDGPAPAATGPATWRLRFFLAPDALKNGTKPLVLLDELRAMGTATVTADTSRIPRLDALEPTRMHVGWQVDLATDKPLAEIEEVFAFDRPNMTLEIVRADAPAAKPLPAADAVAPRPSEPAEETVRIPATRLDGLMDCVGELVIAQSRLKQAASDIDNATLQAVAEEIERLSGELRESMMTVRLVPIAHLFSRFRRLVHDLAHDTGKKIDFDSEGEATELDKTVLERLSDPLIHLIRNAADHGLEQPDERIAAGKPPVGHIRLIARQAGTEVVIALEDDGRGVDLVRVRSKAVESGLIAEDAVLDETELLQTVFRPGFSTAQKVTGISGRGVGMDVVKSAIEALRGSVELTSTPGKGTRVLLRIPLTLAIIDGLMVRVADERYIIPLSAVDECVELAPGSDERGDGRRLMALRGHFVPYLCLRDVFETDSTPDPFQKIVVVSAGTGRIGLVVDEIVGDHQTVIKPLSRLHAGIGLYSGATILGDGTAALILDIGHLVDFARTTLEPQYANG